MKHDEVVKVQSGSTAPTPQRHNGLGVPNRSVSVGASGLAPEEAGFSVSFGLDAVVGPAQRFDVGEAGRAAVGDRVDVITLEVVPPVAARF
jgi:hypothetical protein